MEKYLQILNRVWKAFLFLGVVFTVMVALLGYFFAKDAVAENPKADMIGLGVIMFCMIIVLIYTNMYKKRQLKKLKTADLPEKLQTYKTVYQKTLQYYDFLTMIPIAAMIYMHNLTPILFSVLALLLIVLNRPTEIKVKMDLSLTNDELEKFKHLKIVARR
ncbi:MAG: hypothetical protein IJ759_01465 [Bacteroidales bacterium]|nr:hypothetical protein [Bacteroidales bacterium]